MALIGFIIGILLMTKTSQATTEEDSEIVDPLAQCDAAIKGVEQEDSTMIVDESTIRLHSTWLSQECEMRAGPEYLIRKYTFFKNGTFLLLRYHYIEESCCIPTHTVIIRGSIKLLGPSTVVSGATDTNFHIDAVNIVPLNRQVAHKFGHKMNLSCGPQPKWQSYVPELIYEEPQQYTAIPLWQGPTYNSLQARSKKRLGMHCLKPFGIEFAELQLLRVQKKQLGPPSDAFYHGPRYQLFLASPPPNVQSRWNHKPTSLQSVPMIRADTIKSCPMCGTVIRATEFTPPLLHQEVALPALIGGYWHSEGCESSQGGVWFKRQFQIYSGDKLWTGRWDYYDDPRCLMFLYAVIAAGSYTQRPGKHHSEIDKNAFFDYFRDGDASQKLKRSVADNPVTPEITRGKKNTSYKIARKIFARGKGGSKRQRRSLSDSYSDNDQLYESYNAQSSTSQSRFAAMLRGHQAQEITTKRPPSTPSGTTELDLHIAENSLISGIVVSARRCDIDQPGVPLINWSRTCIPHAIEAPSTLKLRAKLGVNWNGQYILRLGARDDNTWNAPLRQCAQIPPYNSALRTQLRSSFILRFGLLSSATVTATTSIWLFVPQILLWLVYDLIR